MHKIIIILFSIVTVCGIVCIFSYYNYEQNLLQGDIQKTSKDEEMLSIFPELTEYSNYSIQDAATKGDIAFIEKYLLTGGAIDYGDAYGKTMLHYAVDGAKIDTIVYLLSKGAHPYGFWYEPSPGDGYGRTPSGTPIDAAYKLCENPDFLPETSKSIINILESSATFVNTDSEKIIEYIEEDNVDGIASILALGRALNNDVAERINWYALENNNLTIFKASSLHPSFSLLITIEKFWAALVKKSDDKQDWINTLRDSINKRDYAKWKFMCIASGDCDDRRAADSFLVLGCAQGNIDLVKLALVLGADPTMEIREDTTVVDYVGKDWSEIFGVNIYEALPDWPTENDDEIRQLLQAHIDSN